MKKLQLVLGISGIILTSCATDKAGQLRQDRPITLGYLGGSYRLQHNIDVGATIDIGSKLDFVYDKDKENVYLGAFSNLAIGPEKDDSLTIRNVEYKTKPSLNIFARYYIWDQSAFFVGGAYTYKQEVFKYNTLQTGETTYSNKVVKIEDSFNDHLLSIPVGWAWIWENGFSLGISTGPAIRIKGSTTTSASSDYNESDAKWVQDRHTRETFQFLGAESVGVIGYSF